MRGGWRAWAAVAAVMAILPGIRLPVSGRAPSVLISAQIPVQPPPPPGRVTLAVPGRMNGVPAVAARERFVAVAWAAGDGTRADAVVAVSRDGGRTFEAPIRVNDQPGTVRANPESGPRVALGPPPRAGADAVVAVVWVGREPASTVRWARSADGGRTFAPSARLEGEGAAGNRGWVSLAITERGTPIAVWLDHRGVAPEPEGGGHVHQQTGASSAGERSATGLASVVARARQSALYVAVGGGASRAVAPGVCYCCRTAVAAGPGRRLALVWRHVYEGSVRDIAFSRSTDDGRTFDAPTRLSADGWAIEGCPEDGPAAVFDPRGTLHVAWSTVVQQPRQHKAVFSADVRGRAPAPRVQVSPAGQFAAHPAIVIGPSGEPVLLWEGAGPARGVWMASRGRDGRFGAAARVSGDADATYPAAVRVGAGLAGVWLERQYEQTRIVVQPLS